MAAARVRRAATIGLRKTGRVPHTRRVSERIAFVLSGGGSLGAIQVGMLRALYERGLVPDLIVGTSAGALNGTFIAARPKTMSTIDELLALWQTFEREDFFPLSVSRAVLGLTGRRLGLVDPENLRTLIEEHATITRIQDASTELHVVATDLLSGSEQLLSSGDVVSAVLASAAIPGVYPPVRRGNKVLIDGGVSNNTPISHAVRLGATQVFVLATGTVCRLRRAPRSALAVMMHAFSLIVMQRLRADIEHYDAAAELVVLPAPCEADVLPVDFRRTTRLHDDAYAEAKTFLTGRGA